MDAGNALLSSLENALEQSIEKSAIGAGISALFNAVPGGNLFSGIFKSLGIPGFAAGAWSLPGDMVAQIHQGEMIIPAGPAAGLRSALSGGGSVGGGGHTFVVNYSAERGTTLDTLKAHSREMARLVADEFDRQPSIRPTY